MVKLVNCLQGGVYNKWKGVIVLALVSCGLAGCTIAGGHLTGAGGAGVMPTNPSQADTAASQMPEANLQNADQNARQKSGVKIALLLPLTAKGRVAHTANSLKQAGELALFEFNRKDIILVARDTKGTEEGARMAAQQAIASGAEIVLGPLFAKSVNQVKPLLQQAGIPMIAFSSDARVGGSGTYLQSFLPGHDIDRIVSYSILQGKRRFAALIPATPTGHMIENRFREAVSRHGGEIVILERAKPNPNDMLAPMERIGAVAGTKDENIPSVDAFFLPFGPKLLPSVSPFIPYFEINTKLVKIIGTGQWNYSGIGKEKSLLGGWYPAPAPEKWQGFARKYVETYGVQPARLASLSYDAVSLAIALSSGQKGFRYTPERLTRMSGFAGVDGLFRLHQNGRSERELAILEVQKFGQKIVEAAPTRFRTATTGPKPKQNIFGFQ